VITSFRRGDMAYGVRTLINASNKRSHVLCSQGRGNLKGFVRSRSVVFVVVAEQRHFEKHGVFHLWCHRKQENKGSASPYAPNTESTRPSFCGINGEASQSVGGGDRIVGETRHGVNSTGREEE